MEIFDKNLTEVPEDSIDKNSWFIQALIWRLTGNKPLPEPLLTKVASLGHNELNDTDRVLMKLWNGINSITGSKYMGCLLQGQNSL